MPKEEIETTETIEKTRTEEVIICDSCGVNSSSDDIYIYKFLNSEVGELYFCDDCLDDKDTKPMTERITTAIKHDEEDKYATVLTAILTISVVGFVPLSGIAGVMFSYIYLSLYCHF